MGESLFYSSSILSEDADNACRAIMTHVARVDQVMQALKLSISNEKESQGRLFDCVVSIVVEVETFTFTRILDAIDAEVAKTRSEITEILYRKERSSIDRSWESVSKAALDYLGVNIKSIADYRKLAAYVDVRNAAVHGNGRLTRKQIDNKEVSTRLGLISARVSDGKIVLGEEHAQGAGKTARSFVMVVDSLTWRAPIFE